MSATEIENKEQVLTVLISALAERFKGTPITILAYNQGLSVDKFKIIVSEMNGFDIKV